MTIQDWRSIGELIAAIATVATLIYLALQIRATSTAFRVETRRSEFRTTAPAITSIVESGEVARIFREGLADPNQLSPDDFVRFGFLLGQYVASEAVLYDEVRFGSAPRATLERQRVILAAFLNTPGGRAFWQQWAPVYDEAFRTHVESEILRPSSAA